MRGQIRLGSWRRFTAHEVRTPSRGFIWPATAHVAGLPLSGFGRHSSGVGQMRWSEPDTAVATWRIGDQDDASTSTSTRQDG